MVEAVRGHELLAAQRVGSRGAVRDRREDRLQVPEVERGSRHRGDLAGRDQVGVGGREGVGVDLDVLLQGAARGLAGQVEVGVVGQVEDRRQLAVVVVGLVGQPVPVVVVQREGDPHSELGRVAGALRRAVRWDGAVRLVHLGAGDQAAALVAVRADQLQRHGHAAGSLRGTCRVPDVVAEADEATVQAVRPVVDGQRVGGAVEWERALRDPVAVPADGLAEVRAAEVRRGRRRADEVHVVAQGRETERDVLQVAVPVRDGDRLGGGAVGEEPDLQAVAVGQRVPERLLRRAAIRGVRHR